MAVVTNFVPDGSFESATSLTSNWVEYNKNDNLYSYIDSTNKQSRSKSLRVQNAVTGDYGRFATISLPAGTYTAGAWAQTIAGASGSPFTQACFVVRRSSDFNGFVEQHWTTVNGTWTQRQQAFTLTVATAVDVLVGVGSYGAASGGSARFDSIYVEDVATGAYYFDGSYAADASNTFSWTGTVDNSASKATPVGTSGGGSTGGGSTGGGSTTSPVVSQGWQLAQSNDFSGQTSIDASRFYVYNGFKGTNNTGDYKTARTYIESGKLVLAPLQDDIAGFSTQFRPHVYAAYDLYIAGITSVSGYKPVAFLWPDSEVWADGEVDFLECTDPSGQTFQIFFHKPGNPTDNSKNTRVTADLSKPFKMRVESLPNRVTIYLNDQKVFEVTDTSWIPRKPMHLVVQWDVGAPGSGNGVGVRPNYPAATSIQPKMSISKIDIWLPSTWYANGAPPNMDASERQTKARAIYDAFVATCFTQTGMPSGMPAGAWRVKRPENSDDTVSEGIGYGMIACAYFSDPKLGTGIYDPTAKAKFDGLWTYAKYFRLATGVINWHEFADGSAGTGNNSGGATDGDQDIAFALDMMDRINGSSTAYPYADDARILAKAIGDTEYVPHTGYAYPDVQTNGDQWGFNTNRFMADYFAPAWMRMAYARAGDPLWLTRIAVNAPIALGYFDTNYTTGMVPDESDRSGASIPGTSYKYSYNAIRGWRVALDYLWNGSGAAAGAHNMASKLANFGKAASSGVPANLKAEYNLDGTTSASYTNMAFVQAFGAAATVDSANSDFAAACLTYLYDNRNVSGNATYFGLGLGTISALLMSGLMQPYTTTAPTKALSATGSSASSGAAGLVIRRDLSATSVSTSTGKATLGIPRQLSANTKSQSSGSAELSVGTGRQPVLLQARGGSTSSASGALFQTPQRLSAIGRSSSTGMAALNTAFDASVRPLVSADAEEMYARLGFPFTYADEGLGWPLLRFVAAVVDGLQWTDDLVRDSDDGPGWSAVLDLDRVPDEGIPWLAQFAGVDINPDLSPDAQRLRIRETSGFQRGTLSSLEGAAKQYLTGSRTVVIHERDTSPYHLKVTTFSAETTNPAKTLAALEAQKPAGLVLEFVVSSGATCGALKATGMTCAQLDSTYPTPKAMKLAVLV